MKNSKLFALSLLALVACGTRVEFTPLNSPPSAMVPRSADDVRVFMTQKPEQPYVEVGMIEAQQESGISRDSGPDVVAKMRAEAGKIGCHGIIVLGANDKTVGGKDGVTTLKGYRASCIVFR